MMIVDLIDEVDFIEQLKALDVPVKEADSMTQVEQSLQTWLQEFPEQKPNIMLLFSAWQNNKITILPEVQEVMNKVIETNTKN